MIRFICDMRDSVKIYILKSSCWLSSSIIGKHAKINDATSEQGIQRITLLCQSLEVPNIDTLIQFTQIKLMV